MNQKKYINIKNFILSVDPLWEKYISWTPYNYCMNNPVSALDINEKDSKVYVNFMSDFGAEGNTPSNVGRRRSLETEWNERLAQANDENNIPFGLTLKSPAKGDMKADIIMNAEDMSSSMDAETNNLKTLALTPLALLDELNHAISTTLGGTDLEHKNLFIPLLKEVEMGKIIIPNVIINQMKMKISN